MYRFKLKFFIKNLVICFLGLLIISCTNTTQSASHLPVIEIGKSFDGKKEPVKLSQYASDINYIALETVPESLLPEAFLTQVYSMDDRFVVYGKGNNLTPLLFEADGSFIRKIGTYGRSLKEIVHIHKVFLNYGTNEIVIADNDKFLLYDSLGNYKRSIDVFHNTMQVWAYCIDANAYVYKKRPLVDMRRIPEEHFVFIDSLGNTTGKYAIKRKTFKAYSIYNLPGSDRRTLGANLFSTSKGIVKVSYTDTVYRVDRSENGWCFNPIYKLDFGKYASDEYAGAGLSFARDDGFIETESLVTLIVLFTYSEYPDIDEKYTYSRFIFDKKSGKTDCLPFYEECGYAGFENDIDGGIPFFPLHHKDGKAYQLVDASVFIEMARKCNSEKMKQVAATLTEESNPVLIEVTLK